MCDPYSRYQSQAYDDGRWSKDSPVDPKKHGPKVHIARGRYDLTLLHGSGHCEATVTVRTIIAGYGVGVSMCIEEEAGRVEKLAKVRWMMGLENSELGRFD